MDNGNVEGVWVLNVDALANADTVQEIGVTLPAIDPTASVESVLNTARACLGKPYQFGAEGPNAFDCSGLVFYCFNVNGLAALIGGGRHRANWYFTWFKAQANQFSTSKADAQPGDLVFFGYDTATHIGIYLGADPRARMISALVAPYNVMKTTIYGLVNENGQKLPVLGFGLVGYTG